jgi:flagellar basal-body rod protein FlgC
MSGVFGIFQISGSGLSAQRKKLNAVAQNIANVETTRTPEGGPFRRRHVVFSENPAGANFSSTLNRAISTLTRTDSKHMGNAKSQSSRRMDVPTVQSTETQIEPESFKMIYDPTHPDADENGYVAMPDINIIAEMVEMMAASRAYEANISIARAAKSMFKEALNI